MEQMIAYCGLTCRQCGAYEATMNDDNQKRVEVAKQWSRQYSTILKPEDIECEGCLSMSENLFKHCLVCDIRKCGLEKGVANCAHCDDYGCEKITRFFEMVPDAKKQLDEIRAAL